MKGFLAIAHFSHFYNLTFDGTGIMMYDFNYEIIKKIMNGGRRST